jgi:undecaprenyl-diphosphatase
MHLTQIFDRVDLSVLTFVTSFSGRSAVFDHFVNAISRLDLFKGVMLMCLFWYVWADAPANESMSATEYRHTRLVRVMIGTILLGAVSRGLQVALHVHQRPVLSDLGLNFPITGFNASSLSNWNSFPSDHSMFFFALGTGLWTVNRFAGAAAFAWTILVIDLPRIYLGIHYPSDVVFGALFGCLGMIAFLAVPLKGLERMAGGWRRAHQGLFMAALFLASDQAGHLLADIRDLAHSSVQVLVK